MEWRAVEPLLEAAQHELRVGQMVHSSGFSLFEAMSAVEIGNPKMDAGAVPRQEPTPIEQRPLPLDLTPAQVLGVMDHLLRLEATWQTGSSLAQTLYSSLYMMQVARTSEAQPVLGAYCRATEALCLEAIHVVVQGCVCEDEDFNAFTDGLPLHELVSDVFDIAGAASGVPPASPAAPAVAAGVLPDGTPAPPPPPPPPPAPKAGAGGASAVSEKVLAALSQAADTLQDRGGGGGGAAALPAELAAALVSRLQLRKLLLQGFARLRRRQAADLDAAARLFGRALAELAAVEASAHLAAPGEEGAPLGFDEALNSHLTPPVPPRAVPMFSTQGAVDHYRALLQQLLRITAVAKSVTDFYTLRRFLEAFSASSPCSLARAALYMQLSPTSWQQPLGPMAAAAATAATAGSDAAAAAAAGALNMPPAPAWAPSEAMLRAALAVPPGVERMPDVALLLEQALIAVGNWVQALLFNRARTRRRLRRGLDDWANLYQHALNADANPDVQHAFAAAGWRWTPEHPDDPQGPLATWVEAVSARAALAHLLLGFELQLYEPREYMMLFWYCDYLYSIVQMDNRMLHVARPPPVDPAAAAASAAATGKGGGGKGGGGKGGKAAAAAARAPPAVPPAVPAPPAAPPPPPPRDLLEGLLLELSRHMCQGSLRMALALDAAGVLAPAPALPFNSDAQRFDQRFACLHLLQRPDPVTYEQYVESVEAGAVPASQLLRLASDAYMRARQAAGVVRTHGEGWGASAEQLHEAAAMERVAMQSLVALGLVVRTLGDNGGNAAASDGKAAAAPAAKPALRTAFELVHHQHFPVVVIRSAK